jgi:hypothetical protein
MAEGPAARAECAAVEFGFSDKRFIHCIRLALATACVPDTILEQLRQRVINKNNCYLECRMKLSLAIFLTLIVGAACVGCTAQVETTDDSTKIEAEVPKVEIGDKPVDLDPTTDDDVDIDTPAPGDR